MFGHWHSTIMRNIQVVCVCVCVCVCARVLTSPSTSTAESASTEDCYRSLLKVGHSWTPSPLWSDDIQHYSFALLQVSILPSSLLPLFPQSFLVSPFLPPHPTIGAFQESNTDNSKSKVYTTHTEHTSTSQKPFHTSCVHTHAHRKHSEPIDNSNSIATSSS